VLKLSPFLPYKAIIELNGTRIREARVKADMRVVMQIGEGVDTFHISIHIHSSLLIENLLEKCTQQRASTGHHHVSTATTTPSSGNIYSCDS